jgi:GH24 family phage-related lysozyme (muramidase)
MCQEYFGDLEEHEGCTTWLYCDRRGLVTVGLGNLVSTPGACVALPFAHKKTGLAATDEQKAAAWQAVKHAFDVKNVRPAMYYTPLTDLRLTRDFAYSLMGSRLKAEFLPALRHVCPGFDGFPEPARRALVDMIYSLGIGAFTPAHWPSLLAACNSIPPNWANTLDDGTCDPKSAAAQCHRNGGTETRNDWTAQCFIDAAMATGGETS